ncbi:hypothetical protein HYDPIDRAFT_29364 [Hydnomerulius pinastri MD-312]|uniref:Amidase domain-containing protein n=1 Tax=Hydnomerulius pinastri MD-312 TaxID=994086 RepID=A0A0C9VYW4_9AGAM|nr:hypothetical protein HYDPIDRAFT_29364 [Hydnomerulius pinastri MD-312]
MFPSFSHLIVTPWKSEDVAPKNPLPDLYEASIVEQQSGLKSGHFNSLDLVKAYLTRIEEVNFRGAALRAVIEVNTKALKQAAELDAERSSRGSRGPLHGIPLLIKDNIATLHEEGMNTTAGSLALLGSVVPGDAFVVSKLRKAGAIFIGKANMSEWASFRGESVPNGFSARGGQGSGPYYPLLDPSASSSGSAVAVAVGLAAGSLGSETTGSIVLPASRNNVVGIKPTVGLVSRTGVIPISTHQDTVGPLGRCVSDAALLLSVIAGPDPRDEITLSQPNVIPDYTKALSRSALKGKRLGVPRSLMGHDQTINDAFDRSLVAFRDLGADVTDPVDFASAEQLKSSKAEDIVLTTDFKVDLDKYLSQLVEVPTGVRSLADVIKFNFEHADVELPPPYYEDQSQLIASEASKIDDAYRAALVEDRELGRVRGIDATLEALQLDALILPTHSYATKATGVAGYPIISVPLGFYPSDTKPFPSDPSPLYDRAPNTPFGIAFIGIAYSEFKLISLAYAFEQARTARLQRRAYPLAIPSTQLKDVMCE